MKCIFCKKEISESETSVEHIIPKFLGGNQVIINVCKKCNSQIGHDFEGELSNNTLIKFIQSFYHMKNRHSNRFIVPNLKLKYSENMYIKSDSEGHLFMYNNSKISDDNDQNISLEFDQTDSEEKIKNTINKKVSRLNKKNNRENLGYTITKNKKRIVQGIPEKTKLSIPNSLLIKLNLKIAYEFACICIGEEYLEDSLGDSIRMFVKSGENETMPPKECALKISYNERKLTFCVNKVAEVANENTKRIYFNTPLMFPSMGNFSHEISLKNINGRITVTINLFDIFHSSICVSENGLLYKYNTGEICKLIIGIQNNKPINQLITNYEDIKAQFNK